MKYLSGVQMFIFVMGWVFAILSYLYPMLLWLILVIGIYVYAANRSEN